MPRKILLIVVLALVTLLSGYLVWRFNPPPPQICLDGKCRPIK